MGTAKKENSKKQERELNNLQVIYAYRLFERREMRFGSDCCRFGICLNAGQNEYLDYCFLISVAPLPSVTFFVSVFFSTS